MDTYRVELPQPQPVANEDEFVTNSGRKVKQGGHQENAHLVPDSQQNHDMLSSGVSVLSADFNQNPSQKDRDLSNSVQAQLHLSLDRLSENYDPDDLKRLQDKNKANKEKLLSAQNQKNNPEVAYLENKKEDSERGKLGITGLFGCICKTPQTGDAEEVKKKQENVVSKDSLDVDSFSLSQSASEEISEEDEDDDIHTVVADSLDYSSTGEASTPVNSNYEKSAGSVDNNRRNRPQDESRYDEREDKYADLRYNPNWKKQITKASPEPPVVIDFNQAPKFERLEDSLEQFPNSQRGGGAIVMHQKQLFSPVLPSWQNENLYGTTNISPTRLSHDVAKMKKTNAEYEDQFNKMLEAEILSKATGGTMEQSYGVQKKITQQNMPPLESPQVHQQSGDSILIRKLDSQEQSPGEETLIGGYQALPARHRIPSPNQEAQNPLAVISNQQTKMVAAQAPGPQLTIRQSEPFVDRKDPLSALSPRIKNRVHVAPTPPKFPKPKNQIDYVELNRQRVGRKTNSAGYLELHSKRVSQIEQVKSRSQSELKGSIKKFTGSNGGQISPIADAEYKPLAGTVEDIWLKQAERLKIAKGERVNKGKIIHPSPQHGTRNTVQGATFLVSPRDPSQRLQDKPAEMQEVSQDDIEKIGGLYSRLHQVNNREFVQNFTQARVSLPIPSQRNAFNSPQLLNRTGLHKNEQIHFMNQESATHSQFSEQNMTLAPQYALSGNADVWKNQDESHQTTILPPSNHATSRPGRRVTFLGDDEMLAIEGINDQLLHSASTQATHGFGRYKLPLPPTPPARSQRHSLERSPKRESLGKENISIEDYYDVRQVTFPILPPILKTPQKTSPLKSSPNGRNTINHKEDPNGSYMEQHEKQKNRPKYKKYTVTDYRNLKKDVKLGGLGPDLESCRAKVEKADRAKKYSEFIRKQHMSNAIVKTRSTPDMDVWDENSNVLSDENHYFSTTMDDKLRKELYEKRRRAIEYARLVPRPKQKPKRNYPEPPVSMSTSSASNNPSILSGNHSPGSNDEAIDFNWGLLQMLKERHEKEKAQVATFSGNI